MAFKITKDHLTHEGEEHSSVGVFGPRSISPESEAKLNEGEGIKFKMFDDDNILYYEGLYLEVDDSDEFEPLDCFGLPDSGCVKIQNFDPKTNKWETV